MRLLAAAAPVAPLPTGGAVQLILPVPAKSVIYLAHGQPMLALSAKENTGRLVVTDRHQGRMD